MKKPPGNSARLAALSLLEAVMDEGLNLGEANDSHRPPDARDRAFARHLAFGVFRWLTALEWLAQQLLKRPFKTRDRDIHRLILIGIFELWKGGSPPHAAINEATECARRLGKPWATALVNAVLRRFQREQISLLERLEQVDERFAHPGWLLQALRSDWPGNWLEIVAANNCAAPLWLRLNPGRQAEDPVKLLEQSGFTVSPHPLVSSAIEVDPAATVTALPGFSKGLFSVQDPAAQLAAELIDLGDGLRVLDACAAPGGKTCHMLESAPGIELIALDRNPRRLSMITENVKRLGLDLNVRTRLLAADASEPPSWWDGVPFDRILLDAPCTATGVIRRHPEIKYLRNPEQVREAVELQRRLLDRLWPLLRPEGILLYATCSVLKEENSGQIKEFIERWPEADSIDLGSGWGHEQEFGRQILPGEQEMDGFYYAGLRKHP